MAVLAGRVDGPAGAAPDPRRSLHLPVRSALRRRRRGDGAALLGRTRPDRGIVRPSGRSQRRRHPYRCAPRRPAVPRLDGDRLSTARMDAIDAELQRGRPVLTLIEDRPARFHYVVVVATTPDAVVFHDPARAPLRVVGRSGVRPAMAGGETLDGGRRSRRARAGRTGSGH